MTSKHLQRGAVNGAVITMLIGALVLGGLLISSAVSGYELPF
jgi:archaellum component FlaF (FlaF/FlaG flagellin family)